MNIAEAIGKIGMFLRENNADEETMKAYDTIREVLTQLIFTMIPHNKESE